MSISWGDIWFESEVSGLVELFIDVEPFWKDIKSWMYENKENE